MYHTVGECFPSSTEVVGVALNLRTTGARPAVWTRGAADEIGQKAIGREFKRLVGLPVTKSVGYALHVDSKQQPSGKFLWSTFKGDMQV